MKQAAKGAAPKGGGKSGGSTLLGVFIGLVVGVSIAFGVVWYLNKTPLPFQDKTGRAADKPAEKPGAAKAPEPLPGKPGDKVGEKPRFEFYKILPGDATPAPAPAAQPAAAPATPAAPAADSGETFFLQAGAFQKAADADNLKAKLTLMGVEVGVQEVDVAEKGTLYRVRIGPYATPEAMNKARQQLAQSGVQTTLIKIKEAKKN